MEKTTTDGRSIEKELFIKATPQRVFLALTEQAELERWFLVKAELDFGPGMVIGGMLGTTVWRLCYHVLPGIPATPAPFVIVGMMALFGGIAHTPLAVMLMVAEMTGNLSMLAPAMIAVGIASILVGKTTIYTSQVDTRAASPAHLLQLSFPLLSTLAAWQAMAALTVTFTGEQT